MINPLRLKDYVTLGNILGGMASMYASIEGSADWAFYWMLIAWGFDSIDGSVARLTGGGNRFGEVFDNVADLVAYSLAPSFLVFLVYHLPRETGGAGWPVWAAGLLASLPTVFGCIRMARNNVMDFSIPGYHLGLPRTVYALYLGSLFCSHLFHGPWMTNSSGPANPILFGLAAVFVAATSFLILSVRLFHAKPKKPTPSVMFGTVWFFATTVLSFIVGGLVDDHRIVFDAFVANFTLYTWFGWMIIPPKAKTQIREVQAQLAEKWKAEMGPFRDHAGG